MSFNLKDKFSIGFKNKMVRLCERAIYLFNCAEDIFSILLKIAFRKDSVPWETYLLEKFTVYDKDRAGIFKEKKSIILFVNALEIFGLTTFCTELKRLFPNNKLVLMTDNIDAYKLSKELTFIDQVFYSPWDFSFFSKRVIKKFNVELVMFLPKSFHPILIKTCKFRKIFTCLVSGHFTKEMLINDYDAYHIKRLLDNNTYEELDMISLITETYKTDLEQVVKRKDIYVLGDIRLDVSHAKASIKEKEDFYKLAKLSSFDKIIIAGGTAFDEELIFNAYKLILKKFSQAKLIIVPRHVERVDEVIRSAKKNELNCVKLSVLMKTPLQVLVIDQPIQLGKFYSIADLAVYGRTFLPPFGNTNILEACVHGKPIIFGTQLKRYRPFVEEVLKQHPEMQVSNSEELAKSLIYFLTDKKESERVGEKLKKITEQGEKTAIHNAEAVYHSWTKFQNMN